MAKLLFPVPELWLGAIWVCEVGLIAPVKSTAFALPQSYMDRM